MYIAQGNYYTHGVKTLDEILDITNAEPWDTAFCSDNGRVFWYDDDNLWLSADCVKMDRDSQETAPSMPGDRYKLVAYRGTTPEEFAAIINNTDGLFPFGVLLDYDATSDTMSIATCGKYKMIADDTTVDAGDYVDGVTDGTSTRGRVVGRTGDGSSANINTKAVALQDAALAGDEFWAYVHVKLETY
jgi:hypothetical protein